MQQNFLTRAVRTEGDLDLVQEQTSPGHIESEKVRPTGSEPVKAMMEVEIHI